MARWCLLLSLCGCVCPAACTLAEAPSRNIQAVIDAFDPPVPPPAGEMAGVSVVLDALGGGEIGEARHRGESNLWTAAYLHHFLMKAGASSAMTRRDARPLATSGTTRSAVLLERCKLAEAHLLLAIDHAAPAEPAKRDGNPLSTTLAKAMATANVVQTARIEPGVDEFLPAVTIHLTPISMKLPRPERLLQHRKQAEGIYAALRDSLREHRSAFDQDRVRRWPHLEAAGSIEPPLTWQARRRKRLEQLTRAIWPDGDLPVERADWFVSMFARLGVSDPTAVYYRPRATQKDGLVIIEGETTVPSLLPTAEEALAIVGVNAVQSRMRGLPDRGVLGDRLFGICRRAEALMYAEPTGTSRPQTQLLLGERVFLLDRAPGFLLVLAGDGYWGWVREQSVRQMTQHEFQQYTRPAQAVLLHDLESDDDWIQAGSRLPVSEVAANAVKLLTPDGGTLQVEKSIVRLLDHRRAHAETVDVALALLHTPYIFGGIAPAGMDCSGLVGNLHKRQGLAAARDASQQLVSGELVATSWYRDDIRLGDRLYFINATGKVYHTGIAISPTHFVHSSPPAVQISSLVKGDRLYGSSWDRDFFVAKRP